MQDNAIAFDKSLKELRNFSSQLYHAADYCETTFLNSEDKTLVVENTKEYISRAIVTVVDHLGSISANLELHILKSNSVPETEHKIDNLKHRLLTCQHNSHKLALPRFHWTADFSRFHCRYIMPPLTDSAMIMNSTFPRISGNDAKSEKDNQFETEEPLFLYTYNHKPNLYKNSTRDMDKKNGFSTTVVPVSDRLSILPKTVHSSFRFQEAQKLKRSTINWKMMHNKDIASIIRRGKRILT
ncbi:hypothetical protein ACJIZ3_024474 [Penstemon smallii]|uniref:Uncharacterized protein n=1 Tax=Penstemon smallii TaxID=265156 RepID=A0ABD3TV39_9LAMI